VTAAGHEFVQLVPAGPAEPTPTAQWTGTSSGSGPLTMEFLLTPSGMMIGSYYREVGVVARLTTE